MKIRPCRHSIIVLLTGLVSGCASTGNSSFKYEQPLPSSPVENEVVVAEPFDVVWDRLVRNLSGSYFVINNIDKESRLVNLSFTAEQPEEFVDCGRSTREVTFRGQTERFDYAVAGDSTYRASGTWGPYNNLPMVGEFRRNATLEGRMNVYAAPVEGGTRIAANARYVWSAKVSGVAEMFNAFGQSIGTQNIPPDPNSDPITFDTGREGRLMAGPDEIVCRSNGELEKRILDAARR